MSRPRWAAGFLAWLDEAPPPAGFGQLRILRGDRWLLGPAPPDGEPIPLEALRERVRRAADGGYRALPTSPDLPAGWLVRDLDDDGLIAAIETVYPGALALWHAEREGCLRVVHWPETQRRQTGQQGLLKRLDDESAARAAAVCCGPESCLRRRLWRLAADAPSDAPSGDGAIPCPEACSLFLSFARELVGALRGESSADDPRLRAALGWEP